MTYPPGKFQIVANPNRYEFGMADRLRKTLTVNNMSVEGIAEQLHLSRNTIGNYLSGRTIPDHRTLVVWAGMFAVPVEWLTDGVWPTDWHEAYIDGIRAQNGLDPIFEAANEETPATEVTGANGSRLSESNRRPFHYE